MVLPLRNESSVGEVLQRGHRLSHWWECLLVAPLRSFARLPLLAALCVLVLTSGATPVAASVQRVVIAPEEAPQNERAAHPGDIFSVALLTVGQGNELWDSFGHNALWIENTESGQALAYDWGRFSFAQEGFWTNLLMGRMVYQMGWTSPQALLGHYESLDRTITLQHLNLSGELKLELLREITRNQGDPEYRYEYFLDNCSTRVRDLIDQASGGALSRQTASQEADYRFHTRRLTQHSLPLWAGFDVLLGNNGDVPVSRWEALFTPLELVEAVREVEVEWGGDTMPLVASEEVVYASSRPDEPEEPQSMMAVFSMLGLGFATVLGVLGLLSAKGQRLPRLAFGIAASSWSLLAGIVGVALVFVWATDHIWMHWNENALQFTPFSLALVPLIAAAAWRKRTSSLALWLATAALACSVLGLLIQVFPGFDQGNGELIALALPVHAALFWSLREMSPTPER